MADPLPFLGEPPTRRPRRASDVPALRGKRAILSQPEGFIYDVRVISEVYRDGAGLEVVDVCSEQAYYRWMLTDVPPERRTYPLPLVWIE